LRNGLSVYEVLFVDIIKRVLELEKDRRVTFILLAIEVEKSLLYLDISNSTSNVKTLPFQYLGSNIRL